MFLAGFPLNIADMLRNNATVCINGNAYFSIFYTHPIKKSPKFATKKQTSVTCNDA